MKKDSPITALKSLVAEHGIRGTARLKGISPSFVSAVLKGDKPMTDNLAKKLGFRKATTWEKINPKD